MSIPSANFVIFLTFTQNYPRSLIAVDCQNCAKLRYFAR